LLTLAQQPELYARLRAHPELIAAAVEEQLRMGSPVQGFYRTATRDYPVGGVTIPAGARVTAVVRRRQPRPAPLRKIRTPSTSTGIRPTTSLRRRVSTTAWRAADPAGGRSVFSQLLPRVEEIRLAGDYRYLDNPTMRGLEHLPLELIPTKGA